MEVSTSTEREDETTETYVTEQTAPSTGADIDFTPTEAILEIESISTTTARPIETTTAVDEGEQIVHELQCKPDGSTSSDETIAMKCKETEDEEPITVLINSSLLDLGSFDRSKFKIVVKDLMLMEMKRMSEEQRPVIASPFKRK